MDKSAQTLPLVSDVGAVAMLLSLAGFIRPLMESRQIEMPSHIVLQVGDVESDEMLSRMLKNLGATIDMGVSKVRSHQCLVASVSRNYKSRILRLLEREGLLVVFIVPGIVPLPLMDCCTVQLDGRIAREEARLLAAEVELFKDYARRNPSLIIRDLDSFKSTNWYLENQFASSLAVSLHAVLEAYQSCYRSMHYEADTDAWLGHLKGAVARSIRQTEGQGCDIMQPMRALVIGYIEAHPEIILCDVEEVTERVAKALEHDRAILYDDTWYYFPEKLFRFVCEPLHGIVSVLEIKRRLLEEGHLFVNRGVTDYTTKKAYTTAYGQPCRKRFLKVSRSFIIEDGSLKLEERGDSHVHRND